MALTQFTVEYDLLAATTDSSDAGADSDLIALVGDVVFTAQFKDNRAIQAPGYSPRPTGFKVLEITGYLDTDGRLKSAQSGTVGVRLPANDPVLGLEVLVYKVDFNLRTPSGQRVRVDSGYIEAPATDITVNLAEVLQTAGESSSPITKIAPSGVRGEAGALVFSFAGVDIPDPVPITGPIGDVVAEQLPDAVDSAIESADIPGQVDAAVTAADLPGQVEAVVAAELPGVAAEQIPPLVAVEVSTGLAAANIPGLVVATIAEDASVIAAAEAAVDDAVAGTDVVTGSTTSNDDDIHFGLRDSVGRQQLIAKSDGTVSIPLPTMAGLKLRAADSAQGYVFGFRDSSGRISENVIGLDGQVPGWVLSRWADRMGWGSTTSRDWLIVCAGQSNMAGTMVDTPSGVYDVDSRLVYYNSTTNTLDTVSTSEGALWATIGRELVKSAPSDVRVIVVNAAVGGSGFYAADSAGTWDRTVTNNPNGNNYNKMVTAASAARVLAPDAKMAGFFWSQGENDTIFFTEAQYAALLDDLIGAFRTAMSAPDLPAVIGSMVPEWVADNSGTPGVGYGSAAERLRIQKALMDTPRRLARSAFVYGPVGMANPAGIIHFVTAGMRARGAAMVAALERAYWNFVGALPVPPQNLRLARSGTTLTATWDAPPTRHTAFTVEFSTNGGSTWSAMTKPDGVIGLSATATISSSDVVQVRASTTNDTTATPTSGYVYATI